MQQIVISIIYDNRKENPNMQEGWGFSCLVEIGHRKILFDTGADKNVFFSNLQQLRVSLEEITDVVFSHKHSDHVAGFQEIVSKIKKEARLFLPKKFPVSIFPSLLSVSYVSDFAQIDTDVYTFVLRGGFRLYEQALVLRSGRGLVIITGCAHPGIIHLLEVIKERFREPIHLVLGGFHLFRKNLKSINKIVDQFRALEVEKAAPCHCSGDAAIAAFENAYPDCFYKIGTGTIIRLDS